MNLLKKILLVIITLSIVISFLFTLTGCPPTAKEEVEETTTEEITTTEEVTEGVEETVEQKEPSIKIISITGYNIETDTHYALVNDTFKANITDVDIGLKLKNIDVKEDTITVSTYLNGIFDSSFPINDTLEYDSGAYYFSIFYEDGGIYKKGNHKFIFKVNLKNVETVEFSVEPIEEEIAEEITEVEMPDLSDAIITLQDLPQGFTEVSPSTFGTSKEMLSYGEFKVENLFTFMNNQPFQLIMGYNALLPTQFEKTSFDVALNNPDFMMDMFISEMGEAEILERKELTYLNDIGDTSAGFTIAFNIKDSPKPFRLDLTMFRRDIVGACIFSMYFDDETPTTSIDEIVSIFDNRIFEVISSNF